MKRDEMSMAQEELNAALLGFGTVGTGVYKIIQRQRPEMMQKLNTHLNIRSILVRDVKKHQSKVEDPSILTTSFEEILEDPKIDIIIELMGGIEPAYTYVRSALEAGKNVVTANKDLIADLNALRFSTNPYNIDRLAIAAGIASLAHDEVNREHCRAVMENREYTVDELGRMGFEMTPSTANFIFVRHPEIHGAELFRRLRERGVIIRHWDKPELADYNRITIGSREQMDILLREVKDILSEEVAK